MKLNEVIAKYGNQEVDESKIKEVLGVQESKVWKPTLTEDEKVILRNLPKEYEWIARAEDNELCIFENRPIKRNGDLFCSLRSINIEEFNHLFQFIKWEDEPYEIKELLK